jgi:hypothetical protein
VADRGAGYDGRRLVACAQREMSAQSHAGRPPTVQRGSGSSPRSFQVSTVARLTARRSAISGIPTGSMRRSVEKVLTPDKGCGDNHYMTFRPHQDSIERSDALLICAGWLQRNNLGTFDSWLAHEIDNLINLYLASGEDALWSIFE